MKLLEHLHGTGVVIVENGDEVTAKYDIRITQDEPEATAGVSPARAYKHVVGRVWSQNDPYFVLGHVRKILTLRMEDGRKIKFFHRDAEGNIGLTEWIG